jgi:cytoskeleton protein RodZ
MQSIGERLEEARKKKGISIREAAEATKIRGDYLSQFENNRFDINLTEIYVRGFLRSYATYLKLSGDKIVNDYAALGRAENRPRQPSREIYGRMDVSIASAEDRGEVVVAEETAAPQVAHRQPAVTRGSNVAAEPAIDPAMLFKLGKWAAYAVLALLFIWGVKAIIDGGKSSPAKSTAAPVAVASVGDKTVITALGTVRIQVWEKIPNAPSPDESYGAVLVSERTLAQGETATFYKTGPVYIRASAQENIQIDIGKKRILPSSYGYKGDRPIALQ